MASVPVAATPAPAAATPAPAAATPAAATPVPPPDWHALLASKQDWARALLFDHEGNVMGQKWAGILPSRQEIHNLMTLLDNRDHTIGHGIMVSGQHFECHRWYPHMCYGRRGDANHGEGVCVIRSTVRASNRHVWLLLTYVFPMISARAIPQAVELLAAHVEVLQS
eukprot:gnl/Spiro4/16763_TR9026_c0_g1_i1.p1 gnl/Spiro4/16763_TR9026_c0_g1~~gnl/Spiro4/16763_TR9026_c0_g1_i1.p1  ORF type:complete len:177 (-),score=17.70 gnl/Spiro4/16763_TR9026_c0_g1_i1:162-662(-)